VPGAESLVPLTFLMVVGTVTIYGLSASPVARWLGLAQPQPRGVLIVGAHSWAREIAKMLEEPGREVRLVDTNWQNISAARMAGLQAVYASALSEHALDELDSGADRPSSRADLQRRGELAGGAAFRRALRA
jgi:hypothetical protein